MSQIILVCSAFRLSDGGPAPRVHKSRVQRLSCPVRFSQKPLHMLMLKIMFMLFVLYFQETKNNK